MSNDWKVYAMNDCDWYAARTPEEALEAMRGNMGYESLEHLRADAMCDAEPEELSTAALNDLRFHLDDSRTGPTISFREQLERMIADGDPLPGFFASTEF